MQSPSRRNTLSAPVSGGPGVSLLAAAALAFGAAGLGFGAFFYLVPYHRKIAQLDRLGKELAARPANRPHVDVQGQDAGARAQSQMKALQTKIADQLAGAAPTVTPGAHRMLVRFSEEKLFDARGPYLTKAGQETIQTLGQLLGAQVHRVVIAAPMGGATVPRWIRAQLPTPADLSAARAGNALKAVVKGGVRAETVLAVIGTFTADQPDGTPTLDLEIEP
jgi:flagellar motor protein MotB